MPRVSTLWHSYDNISYLLYKFRPSFHVTNKKKRFGNRIAPRPQTQKRVKTYDIGPIVSHKPKCLIFEDETNEVSKITSAAIFTGRMQKSGQSSTLQTSTNFSTIIIKSLILNRYTVYVGDYINISV